MQGNLSSFSSQHEKLQKQFFIALMYQVGCLVFFHLPSLFIFILPFFDTKISFHSTVLIYSFNVYPLVDLLILLKVVSEYKIALKKFRDMIAGEWAMIFRNGGIPEPSMSVVNARIVLEACYEGMGGYCRGELYSRTINVRGYVKDVIFQILLQ
ncbi:hypothetical protein L3Y34_006487 [Caenorhabditis briggsae]|uniref:Uncharacterized protein n=1 Tax=Caenorhabditis briggsae TaxID=6238 RepID=A0AAE8ZWM9_CAEBR|nr:hypothetical protein L3Y34_006487 [Caenorhabditis briggsae]